MENVVDDRLSPIGCDVIGNYMVSVTGEIIRS